MTQANRRKYDARLRQIVLESISDILGNLFDGPIEKSRKKRLGDDIQASINDLKAYLHRTRRPSQRNLYRIMCTAKEADEKRHPDAKKLKELFNKTVMAFNMTKMFAPLK